MTISDQEEQAERRRVLLQDADLRRQQEEAAQRAKERSGTFFSHGLAAANDLGGGRFAGVNPTTVVGAEHAVKYPQAGPPFQRDPVPHEPPLGYRIDAMPIEPSADLSAVEQTDDPAHAPSGGSLVQQPSGDLMSERAGSSPSQKDQNNG
jgi:hypothetical protein